MFDKEFENPYTYESRIKNGIEILKKWHPEKYKSISKGLGKYNTAVLGSIDEKIINSSGLDTKEQIVNLINHYSSKKINLKQSPHTLKQKTIYRIKKWNPDNYEDILEKLSDKEIEKLSKVDDAIISTYGISSVEQIRICIKLNEKPKTHGQKISFYNGKMQEFLYNTFISYRKIKDQSIDTDIDAENFDYEFFEELIENSINIYLKYHYKK